MLTPVDRVDVPTAADLIPAQWRVAVRLDLRSSHEPQPPLDDGGGYLVVEREAVAGDRLRDVQAAAEIIQVAPEEHPEVAHLERPHGHDPRRTQGRLDRTDAGHGPSSRSCRTDWLCVPYLGSGTATFAPSRVRNSSAFTFCPARQ